MPNANAFPARSKTATEVRTGAVSFDGKLESGEALTGTPTCTVTPASGAPTVDNIVVTTGVDCDRAGVDVSRERWHGRRKIRTAVSVRVKQHSRPDASSSMQRCD
jgi:hypothetical protein